MLERIRKHQKWLWFLLIVVVIVTFVIFFTPTVGRRGLPAGRGVVGVVFGRSVTMDEFRDIQKEVYLAFYLSYGVFPDDAAVRGIDFDPVQQTQQRLVLIEMARRAGIEVDSGAVAEWIRTRLADPERPGMAREVYERLISSPVMQRLGMNVRGLNEFVEHEVMISQLRDTVSLLGLLVVPREAKRRYEILHEKFSVVGLVFSATNFWDHVSLSEADLVQYYSNHLARYRIPERVVVYYVKFPFTNYYSAAEQDLAQQTNLEQLLEQEYLRRGTNSFVDASGKPLPADQAKERIRQELREQRAQVIAHREAAKFGNKVFDLEPLSTENFLKLANEAGLVAQQTEPFTEAAGPKEFPATGEVIQAIFELNESRPFTRLFVLRDGVYLFALKERLASEIPPFEQVRSRVETDARADRAAEMAREAARTVREKLVAELQAGKSFDEACQLVGVQPVKLPTFSLADPMPDGWPRELSYQQVRAAVTELRPGELSQVISVASGANLLYLYDLRVPPEEEVQQGVRDLLAQVRRSRLMTAFQDWFEYQYRLGEIRFAQTGRRSNASER